jgi:hypothetical protein
MKLLFPFEEIILDEYRKSMSGMWEKSKEIIRNRLIEAGTSFSQFVEMHGSKIIME